MRHLQTTWLCKAAAGTLPFSFVAPMVNFRSEQKDVEARKKASTIEAKIQSFIPGKLIVVSIGVLTHPLSDWLARALTGWLTHSHPFTGGEMATFNLYAE